MKITRLEPRLHVADVQASIVFYRDVLGFTVTVTFPEESPSFAMLESGEVGIQLGGIEATKPHAVPSNCTFYFHVKDALGWHQRLKDRVSIEWGPEVYFYQRREFAFRDPDGHLIIFSEETDDPVTCKE